MCQSHVACRLRLARDHRRADRAGGHRRRWPQGPVRDPGLGHAEGDDLIESQFASEQGSILNLVFAAPEGQRLDTPERKAAIAKAIALLKSNEFKATQDRAGIDSVGDPFSKNTFSDSGRIAYAEAQFDRVIYTKDRDAVVAVQDACGRRSSPPA